MGAGHPAVQGTVTFPPEIPAHVEKLGERDEEGGLWNEFDNDGDNDVMIRQSQQ